MRIDRLTLARYGHLSDVALEFPTDRGLHVVLGANEAGKSTALAAIGDALFGFPHRTDYAFLHDTRELRLLLSVRTRDERAGQFVRLKRRKDDLLDGAGRPLPEAALATFLGGATRGRFDQVFGLNAAELRRGGDAILQGKGEVGESILQAHIGMIGFRALVERLGEGAAQLHGDRRRRRDLHVSVDAFHAARQDLDARSIELADYKEKRAERDRLTAARAANARESEALHAERTRLERIRRTAPALRARARAVAQRGAMGEVPALPADAETQRQSATLARDRAAHDLARERALDLVLASQLAGLEVDTALLNDGDAIDALSAEQNRIVAARRDRDEQRIIASHRQRAVEEAGRRLGLSADAAALAGLVPNALTRSAARRATERHERLATLWQAASEEGDATARHTAQAEATLAASPPAEPFTALRAAIDAAKAEGRIDDDVRQAGAALAARASDRSQALAALPLWSGSADALAAATVPLEAVLLRHTQALQATDAALRAQRDKRAACETTLQEIAASLHGLSAVGDLPTAAAIAEARDRRDRAWRLIRRHHVEGGAAPAAAELEALPPTGLPDTLEHLTRTADVLADRRASDAERVATFEQLRARQAQQVAMRDIAASAEADALAAHAAAVAAWRDAWQPAGIAADEPPVMRDWLRQRAAVLDRSAREAEARRTLEAASARHAAAWSALVPLLPTDAVPAGGRLADLLRNAVLICAGREQADAAHAKARADARQARADADKAAQTRATLDAERAAWLVKWAPVAAALGLPGEASAEDGRQALELWNAIEQDVQKWRAAEERVAQMSLSIDGFVSAAADLAHRLAPELADADPHDAVRTFAARLAATRAAAAEHARKTKERADINERVARAAAAHDAAEATLDGLRRLANAVDDAGLQAAIARAAEHAALSRQITERENELAREDRSPADLAVDADGIDLDSLPGRLAEIEERLRAIADENAACASQLTELRAALQAMEQGRDAAGAAQDMRNALAEIDDIAARYVRLRLAHTLLRAGIDRFRRQQQGPLLGRAGALFARLTEGRYHRLSVDEGDDGKMTLVAVRPDGSECPADRLSEGSRDQLYLALRLAAIESYATRAEPLPFIADDLLVNFDDRRAQAALRVLAEFASVTQTILFTHHAHIFAMAEPAFASLHRLPESGLVAA